MLARREQVRCVAVPHIVDADVRYARDRNELLERSVEVVGAKGLALAGAEDEIMIALDRSKV